LCEAIIENTPVIDEVFAFIEQDELDPLLSSYVSKFLTCLLTKKVAEVITYMKSKGSIVPLFLKHIDVTILLEVLLKIIIADEHAADLQIGQWLCEQKLIPSLIEKFDKANSEVIHENASQLLLEIIAATLHNPTHMTGSSIVEVLESEQTTQQLFSYAFSDGVKSSSLFHILPILIELVRRKGSEVYNDYSALEELPAVLRELSERLEDLARVVVPDEAEEALETSAGTLSPPFGFLRLKTLELFAAVVSTRYEALYLRLAELGFFTQAVGLFFRYEWNNFLHALVEQIVATVLEEGHRNPRLVEAVLGQAKLHEKLAGVGVRHHQLQGRGNFRAGLMGFATQLAGTLLNVADLSPAVAKFLQDCPEWAAYQEGELKETRALQSTPMGVSKEPDEPYADASDAIDDSPIVTQMLAKQGFTDDFPEDFAAGDFDEDDIADILFNPDNRFLKGGFQTDEENFGNEFDDSDSDEEGEQPLPAHSEPIAANGP